MIQHHRSSQLRTNVLGSSIHITISADAFPPHGSLERVGGDVRTEVYEVWLKINRTVRTGHKVGDPETSEAYDINLYHIAMVHAKRLVNATLLISRALFLIDV